MATAPSPNRVARQKAETASITIVVDGRPYVWDPMESNALDASALRQATSFSQSTLMKAATESPDLDVIAAIVFMARRQAGEKNVTFEQVAVDIGYDSEFDIVDSDEAGGDPEA